MRGERTLRAIARALDASAPGGDAEVDIGADADADADNAPDAEACVECAGIDARATPPDAGAPQRGAHAAAAEGSARDEAARSIAPLAGAGSPDGASALRARVGARLSALLADVLKVPVARLEPDAPFERYGIDSLTVVALNESLGRHVDALPKTLFFEYRTLAELTDYFVRRHAGAAWFAPDARAEHGAAGALATLGAATRATQTEQAEQSRVAPLAPPRRVFAAATAATRSRAASAPPAATADAIAVIGLAGRYPQARDLDAFWRNLRDGRDCITEIPAERWNHGDFFDPQKGVAGKTYSKWGGFIEGVDEFDAAFFNIAPRDAERMDPQERLFLQASYQAIEDAGYARASLGAGRVGVFAGVMYSEYQLYATDEHTAGARRKDARGD